MFDLYIFGNGIGCDQSKIAISSVKMPIQKNIKASRDHQVVFANWNVCYQQSIPSYYKEI